jgi:glucose-1-phosphate cytidylyltransferase
MRAVILAGGLGTRLAEETVVRPKPMVEVGGRPLLWHIMKQYAHHAVGEFVVALGYKGDFIKRYFLDYYYAHTPGALSIDLSTGRTSTDHRETEDWRVHLVDTGQESNTGGRVRRLRQWLGDSTFMVTYGDGVGNVDLTRLLAFHRSQGKIGTITAVRPPARYGGLEFDGDLVSRFSEKPQTGEGWINGGFMIFEPAIFDYLTDDTCSLELHALERLASEQQLAAYRHEGFWQCMDTLRDKNLLERLWDENRAPWAVWDAEKVGANEPPAATPAIDPVPVRPTPRSLPIRIDPPEPLRRPLLGRHRETFLLD